MKTFNEIYENLKSLENKQLHNAWEAAEKEKQKASKIAIIICIIVDILFFRFGASNMLSNSVLMLPVMLMSVVIFDLIIFAIIMMVTGLSKKQTEFNKLYKEIVIKTLINNFYNNLEYFPDKSMPEYIYKHLEYEYYNKYHSEDYIEAVINNKNSIQMAEILTQEERSYRNEEGNIQTENITKFYGLFAKITMEKSINSQLRIGENGDAFLSKDRLEMDSSEFEKYFDVKASNSIIGMQLLTADIMEELVQFRNKTKIKFEINLIDNEIYLRFHTGPMFETGRTKNGALDKALLEKYFSILEFSYNLSEGLINLVDETQI